MVPISLFALIGFAVTVYAHLNLSLSHVVATQMGVLTARIVLLFVIVVVIGGVSVGAALGYHPPR